MRSTNNTGVKEWVSRSAWESIQDLLVGCRSWIDLSFSNFGLKTPLPKARASLETYNSLLSSVLVLSIRLYSEVRNDYRGKGTEHVLLEVLEDSIQYRQVDLGEFQQCRSHSLETLLR
jgi:hypothetical protein